MRIRLPTLALKNPEETSPEVQNRGIMVCFHCPTPTPRPIPIPIPIPIKLGSIAMCRSVSTEPTPTPMHVPIPIPVGTVPNLAPISGTDKIGFTSDFHSNFELEGASESVLVEPLYILSVSVSV